MREMEGRRVSAGAKTERNDDYPAMTYKSHLLWAVLAGSASWAAVQVVPLPGVGRLPVGGANEFMLWMAAAVVGGLFPDVDHPHSRMGRAMPLVSWLVRCIAGHRGLTHSLAFLALVGGGLFCFVSMPIGLGFAAGYASHLFGDFLTDGGIPLFWPWRRRVGFRLFANGGFAEAALNVVASSAAFYAWWHLH